MHKTTMVYLPQHHGEDNAVLARTKQQGKVGAGKLLLHHVVIADSFRSRWDIVSVGKEQQSSSRLNLAQGGNAGPTIAATDPVRECAATYKDALGST